MYTQAMDLMAREAKPKVVKSAEDLQREAAFEARIDAGDFIEAKDWMPEHYRKTLVRQISQHARRRSSARPSCSPRCRTRAATASTSMPPPRRWAPAATT
jgi:hypothetical protein